MNRKRTLVLPLALLFAAALLAGACGGGGGNPFGVRSEVVLAASHPADLAFAPDGRLFYVEQYTGAIRVVTAEGQLVPEPFAELQIADLIEWGLTGIALDPHFEQNHYVYAFYTKPVREKPPIAQPVLVRFTEQDNRGVDEKVLIEFPKTVRDNEGFNANGHLVFGPDGFLYISIGDYDTPELVQKLDNPVGKLLRVDAKDGSPAPGNPLTDNPKADPRIFAYGFRENFYFTFHPDTGQIYATDNTTVTCEELNVIEAGGNYGWGNVGKFPFPDCFAGDQIPAIYFFAKKNMKPEQFLSLTFTTGKEFVSKDVYPLLGDTLLVCESDTKVLHRIELGGPDLKEVLKDDPVVKDCLLDVTVNPDGIVYYSNQTEIRRLLPEATPSPPAESP